MLRAAAALGAGQRTRVRLESPAAQLWRGFADADKLRVRKMRDDGSASSLNFAPFGEDSSFHVIIASPAATTADAAATIKHHQFGGFGAVGAT